MEFEYGEEVVHRESGATGAVIDERVRRVRCPFTYAENDCVLVQWFPSTLGPRWVPVDKLDHRDEFYA